MERHVCGIVFIVTLTSAAIFENSNMELDVEEFVEKTMECRHIPGMTISIVKGQGSQRIQFRFLTTFTLL